jgi:predicted RecA/RadA family phage recombinase
MINFKGSDEIVTRVAPGGGVVTGVPVVIGSEFLVPQVTVAATYSFSAVKRGRVLLDSNSGDTFTAGARAFWNPTSDEVEDTDTATNYLIGTVEAAAIADEVIVCLNGNGLAAIDGDISQKADKIVPAAPGNLAGLSAGGNLVDSGIASSGFVTVADLISAGAGDGAALVGLEDSGTHYAAVTVEAAFAELPTVFAKRTLLASVANAEGAALVGIEDVATNITATTVEGALAEIAADGWADADTIADDVISPDHNAVGVAATTMLAGNLFWLELDAEAAATPISFDLTTHAGLAFQFEIVQAIAHCSGANGGGTLQLLDAPGGNEIVPATVCAALNVDTLGGIVRGERIVNGATDTLSIVKNAAGDDGRLMLLCAKV